MFEVDVKNVTEEGRRGGKKGRGPGSVFYLDSYESCITVESQPKH